MIDEHNGILLDNKLVGNKLYSLFEVQGNMLTTFMTFYSDHLIFEITFADLSEVNISKVDNTDGAEVSSYPISTIQTARLNRQ